VTPAQTVELDAQYRLLREEAGLVARPGRTWIEVAGADGAEFLQGQLTNEIETLAVGEGCYAALLDRKGKMRSDMRVLRLADDLIAIEVPAACAEEVSRHLDTYRIGREVEIRARDDLTVLSVIGPRAVEVLGGIPFGAEHAHRVKRIAEHDVRLVATDGGADLVGTSAALHAIGEQLAARGAETATEAATEILRVESGRPAFGAEMGNETIPQEAGINERAVSFDKGCYIGQETVARLHFKGKPNRHLRRLSATEPMPPGAPVVRGEKQVGAIGTAVISPSRGPLALAILRREAEPGDEVQVGTVSARVEEVGA
jgi:tRNA-modifying protein YgfZ